LSRRLLAAVVVVAVAPALFAACGEDEQEAFARDFRSLDKRIGALASDVGKTVNQAAGKSDKEIEDEFGSLAQRTGELAQRVDELDPPDDLRPETDDLSESLGDAQDALRDIQKAAADGDPTAARKATIQLVTSSQDLRDSRRALERATR
jgi:hypothetical protein